MLLFDLPPDETKNLLPKDGTVNYYGKVNSEPLASEFYKILLDEIAWKNDEAIIFGKHIITKRKVAWYGEKQFSYTYSKTTKLRQTITNAKLIGCGSEAPEVNGQLL